LVLLLLLLLAKLGHRLQGPLVDLVPLSPGLVGPVGNILALWRLANGSHTHCLVLGWLVVVSAARILRVVVVLMAPGLVGAWLRDLAVVPAVLQALVGPSLVWLSLVLRGPVCLGLLLLLRHLVPPVLGVLSLGLLVPMLLGDLPLFLATKLGLLLLLLLYLVPPALGLLVPMLLGGLPLLGTDLGLLLLRRLVPPVLDIPSLGLLVPMLLVCLPLLGAGLGLLRRRPLVPPALGVPSLGLLVPVLLGLPLLGAVLSAMLSAILSARFSAAIYRRAPSALLGQLGLPGAVPRLLPVQRLRALQRHPALVRGRRRVKDLRLGTQAGDLIAGAVSGRPWPDGRLVWHPGRARQRPWQRLVEVLKLQSKLRRRPCRPRRLAPLLLLLGAPATSEPRPHRHCGGICERGCGHVSVGSWL
jgi:hypothetical protein